MQRLLLAVALVLPGLSAPAPSSGLFTPVPSSRLPLPAVLVASDGSHARGAVLRARRAARRNMRLRGGMSGDGLDAANDAAAALTLGTPHAALSAGVVPRDGFLARSPVAQLLSLGKAAAGQTVVVCGWARTIRIQGSGTFAFIELNDGSTFDSIQIVADMGIAGWDEIQANAHTHTSWRAEGVLVESPGKGQEIELKATAVRLLGSSPPEQYPLAKGRLPLDFLRGLPHLRVRTNTHGAVARVRSALAFAVHRFFQQQHFHYVHTPIITTADCEGAGELFSVTTLLSATKPPVIPSAAGGSVATGASSGGTDAGGGAAGGWGSTIDYSRDFFKKASFLTVSGQLHAEASALALGKVYTFGPTFRAEQSHTARHLAEFWMIEPEMAFADLQDAMDCAEGMLKSTLAYALESLPAGRNSCKFVP